MTDTSPSTERYREELLALIDEYRELTGVSDSTTSRDAVGESEFVKRLRDGMRFTIRKAEKLENFLRDQISRGPSRRFLARKVRGACTCGRSLPPFLEDQAQSLRAPGDIGRELAEARSEIEALREELRRSAACA